MTPDILLRASALLFAATALGGAAMFVVRVDEAKRHPPHWLAMAHGFLAATGLTLLVAAWMTAPVPRAAAIALLCFTVSAVGGVLLSLGYHMKDRRLPRWLTVGHGALSATGVALVLLAAWGS